MSLSIKQALINQGAEGSTNKQRFRNWLSSEGRTIAEIINNADISGGGSGGGGGELVKTLIWSNDELANITLDNSYPYDDYKNISTLITNEIIDNFISSDTIYEIEVVTVSHLDVDLDGDPVLDKAIKFFENPTSHLLYVSNPYWYPMYTVTVCSTYSLEQIINMYCSIIKSSNNISLEYRIESISNDDIYEGEAEPVNHTTIDSVWTSSDAYGRAVLLQIPYKVYRLDVQ